MTTYYLEDILSEIVEVEHHIHTNEHWRGISADQSGNDWAADQVSTPFVLTSGNNTWGTEVKILGTDDTPIGANKTHFDMHRILVVDLSQASNPYKVRFCYGTGTYAQAIAAGQCTEIMFISSTVAAAQFGGAPSEIKMPRLAVDTKVWADVWCATNAATISFFVGIHEYGEIVSSSDWDSTTSFAEETGIALQSSVNTVSDKVDDVQATADSIETKVDTVQSTIDSVETKVDTVDGIVDNIKTQTDKMHFSGNRIQATALGSESGGIADKSKVGHINILGKQTPVYFNEPAGK